MQYSPRISYTDKTMSVIRASQDAYTMQDLDNFVNLLSEDFDNTIVSVTSADINQGFTITCVNAITESQGMILYHAVNKFCDW